MILGLESIKQDLNKIQQNLNEIEQIVPKAQNLTKISQSIDDEVKSELNSPNYLRQKEDMQYIIKCFKYLRKLGYVSSQYQFSEEFLNKNRYYFGMLISEERHPSVDSIHNLIHNLSAINDGVNKIRYLDDLYNEGQSLITKRLLKYI